jgi:ring-1,2-phenylacetyl-CoA epoxidase subunit PaaA
VKNEEAMSSNKVPTPVTPIRTVEELKTAPAEYREAVRKIVRSHAVNELVGARTFDEAAIALAPNPQAKWLTCRVAMEEYGHHVRFRQLGERLGIPAAEMTPEVKRPLSIFAFPLKTWEEFCVIKLLADLAEILQVEDLMQCSFLPLRNLARMTMPEETFHAQFGRDFCLELCRSEEGRARVQQAIDAYFPLLPAFFGESRSKNNALYRRYGIKRRENDEMRADFLARARALVEGELKLKLPDVAEAA